MSVGLSAQSLASLFPFFVRFDRHFRLIDAGPSMRRVLPSLLVGRSFREVLDFHRPRPATFEDLQKLQTQILVLESPHTATGARLTLRAQFHQVADDEGVLLGSPWVTSSEELRKLDLTFHDYALHDSTADFMMLLQTQRTGLDDAHELAERLRTQSERMRALATAKADFLAHMSHEIRTPLNAVIGFTGVVLETELHAEQREQVEQIQRAGQSLLGVIDNILDFSKLDAGQMTLEEVSFDLYEVLEDATQLLAHTARERGLLLSLIYSSELGRTMVGDPGRLRQVFVNLIANAVKFTSSGAVVVSAEARGDELVISVKDTGPGISGEIAARLFAPFSQGDASMARRFGGTGLGLVLSRRLVDAMGGRLVLDTRVGAGSTFSVVLPWRLSSPSLPGVSRQASLGGEPGPGLDALREALRRLRVDVTPWAEGDACPVVVWRESASPPPRLGPGQRMVRVSRTQRAGALAEPVRDAVLAAAIEGNARAATAPARVERARGRPMHLLIVDDMDVNQRVAAAMVQQLGHTSRAVSTGQEALDLLALTKFDLVLMDCQMPELDGFETTRRLRAQLRDSRFHLPVVAMTAQALVGDREQCLSAGMDDYVSKPVTSRALAQVLARNQPALDGDFVDELCFGTPPTFLLELAEAFDGSSVTQLAQLDVALAAGSATDLARLAHTVKGTASSVGIACVHESCEALEALASSARLSEAQQWVDELRRQLERGRRALQAVARSVAGAQGASSP